MSSGDRDPGAEVTRPPAHLTIALATAADPRDRSVFSGWPASLLGGMERVVGRAIGLDGSLPPRVRSAATLSGAVARLRPADVLAPRGAIGRKVPAADFLGRPSVWARSVSLRRQLRRHAPVDGCLTLGTEFRLPRGLPFVTFQDSTLIQARRSYPWPYLGEMSDAEVAGAAERQRAVYRAAVACCCSSAWAAESIVADYGISPDKVHVVGIGRNHDVPPPPVRDWTRPRFLLVGFDWIRKNGDATVRAFAEVRARHPDAELHLVGGHPPIDAPGVVRHGLLSLGEEADSARLARIYQDATCFVMPSIHEPSATAYAEAAAAGLPCIGTSAGGSATIIGPGGLLVDPADSSALVGAMLHFADPEAARRTGALASAHAELLTWERVAERLVRALAPPGVDPRGLADFL